MKFGKTYVRSDKSIYIDVAAGHFATNHSHVNYYVDPTHLKTNQRAAKNAAMLLARRYENTLAETILCLEGTNMLGAFLAEELAQGNPVGINNGTEIHVLTPELNSNNQMIFRDNTKEMVQGKHVILLLSSVSTGKTIKRALECIEYYKAYLTGICAIFSAKDSYEDMPINAVFTLEDLPDYQSYDPRACPICKESPKIDAIVNEAGFSIL